MSTQSIVTDNIERELKSFISGAKKLAILGIGNELRTDDGLGPFIVENLNFEDSSVLIENVGSVPEAFTRPLAEFGAERIIMVDAADMQKQPGHVELVTKERIGGIALSTHSMPLSFLMIYLEQETCGRTILLGVQPQNVQFGERMTPEIQDIAERIIQLLQHLLTKHLR
jgi:hydrogenase 3 maturation protease